ncbi:MAG: hypothetical protein JWM68_4430 [Verrucomicrobiales bacterium]|nr:hypothetical protein [Verrucomicrobiales bacterium]
MSNDAPQRSRGRIVGFWWLIAAIGLILAVIVNEVAEYKGKIPACYVEGYSSPNPIGQNPTWLTLLKHE